MISITRCVENGGNGMICVQAKPQTGMPGPVARKKMHLKKAHRLSMEAGRTLANCDHGHSGATDGTEKEYK